MKVRFETDPEGLAHGDPERLWAEPVSGSLFRLRNSPFFAKGVSFLDVVEAREADTQGVFDYVRTARASGHSTYRVLVAKGSPDFESCWRRLAEMGCSYESADRGKNWLYSVDVPPEADVFVVYGELEAGEKRSLWLFDEGHCGHPV